MSLLDWKRTHPEEAIELGRVTGRKNKGRTFAGTGKIVAGKENIHSKDWSLSSPDNVPYEFTCLAEFIRTNPELFDPKDLIQKTRTGETNAEKRLSCLRPAAKDHRNSWKGWRWHHKIMNSRYHTTIIDDPANYDGIEVHGVRDLNNDPKDTQCEVDDEHPEFFSVYVHLKQGGVDCVGDFTQHQDAVIYANELNKLFGWPITFCNQWSEIPLPA